MYLCTPIDENTSRFLQELGFSKGIKWKDRNSYWAVEDPYLSLEKKDDSITGIFWRSGKTALTEYKGSHTLVSLSEFIRLIENYKRTLCVQNLKMGQKFRFVVLNQKAMIAQDTYNQTKIVVFNDGSFDSNNFERYKNDEVELL